MALSEKKETVARKYIFRRCPSCTVKLHVNAFLCWKCGKRYNYNANTGQWVNEIVYGSENPSDAIYSKFINDVDKCLICRNTQNGKTCHYAICYGTGKGNCDLCNKFDGFRFMCCQDAQKENKARETNEYEAEKVQQVYRDSIKPYETELRKTA